RLVELVQAAEQMVELSALPELTGPEIRTIPTSVPHEGVGTVEAPRGTLTHHYVTDGRGIVTDVNLIVGTTNNNAPICIAIKRAAQGAIHRGEPVTDGALNRVEMAFRAFDPCFSCATHTLPGNLPMEVVVHDPDGTVVARASRH
ncbi:MAG: nickel-dependent hydrogenase large subunit, partial [Thermoanaerobaculaceae bacterium]|nr:nickel-dependent hydrogenase large subunit [Thermoanaerobaculaceae bacterium]